MTPIRWHRGFDVSRPARLFAYALLAPILGGTLLVVLLGLAMVPVVVPRLIADPSMLALVVVLALVGGPASLLYVWPLLTDPNQREALVRSNWITDLPPSGLLGCAVAGALAQVVALWLTPLGPLLVVGAGTLVGVVGTGLLLTRGQIDPDARRLTVRPSRGGRETSGTATDLDTWTALRRYRLGPVVVLRPSYAPGTGAGAPRLLTIPAWVADAADGTFDAALAAAAPAPGRDPNPAVAATLAVFGLGFAGTGVVLGLLVAVPASLRVWLAGSLGGVGLLFLVLAYREF